MGYVFDDVLGCYVLRFGLCWCCCLLWNWLCFMLWFMLWVMLMILPCFAGGGCACWGQVAGWKMGKVSSSCNITKYRCSSSFKRWALWTWRALVFKKDTPCEKLSLPCASGANGSTKPLGDVSSRRFENAVGRPIVNSQLVGTKCWRKTGTKCNALVQTDLNAFWTWHTKNTRLRYGVWCRRRRGPAQNHFSTLGWWNIIRCIFLRYETTTKTKPLWNFGY